MHAGTAGDVSNRAVAKQLLAPPDWRQLAGPLIRAVKSIVLTFEIRKTSPSGAMHTPLLHGPFLLA